jgi:Rps23 Pro-64 3,4-dihydroxylase Tpa1-like proline 4-hydroxylase
VMLNRLDLESLRRQFRDARPFPHVVIDNFLAPGVAEEVAAAYPTFDRAQEQGFGVNIVNEQRKIQITDSNTFPEPVRRLSNLLASPEFLANIEYITGIPKLVADELLEGGGMHLTGPGGRLDVHVDFNVLKQRQLFRRLNILLYLNPVWRDEWGGHIELWDKAVKNCHLRAQPIMNKCLIFETSEISYHGVTPLKTPPDVARRSFAAYYYTKEAPSHWDGTAHSTIFRARPDENLRRFILMPAEQLRVQLTERLRQSKKWLMGRIGLS